MSQQTITPYRLASLPNKHDLAKQFVGQELGVVRTPALVVDRKVFADNCARMHQRAKDWGASFRAHLKSHKTAEGTRLQLISSVDQTSAVIVSTMMEAWQVVDAGLVKDGTVKDLLYGLPIGPNKLADAAALREEFATHSATVRFLVDHPQQIQALEQFEKTQSSSRKWSVFVKVDAGGKRAGVVPGTAFFEDFVKTALSSTAISVYGFYCHAGHSYSSTSEAEAATFLSAEVEAVNTAAGLARTILTESGAAEPQQPFVLSVGSTPSANSASAEMRERMAALLNGTLELHAGNYPLHDLQQLHTGMIQPSDIAEKILATVISNYPGRGESGADEALCDAGAIAMSKDTGPSGGFGDVIGKPWRLGKVSQEHGILQKTGPAGDEVLAIGEVVAIVPQHACLTLANHGWYYIVDGGISEGKTIVDVWVPWKGW